MKSFPVREEEALDISWERFILENRQNLLPAGHFGPAQADEEPGKESFSMDHTNDGFRWPALRGPWERITPSFRLAFFAACLVGFLTHLYTTDSNTST